MHLLVVCEKALRAVVSSVHSNVVSTLLYIIKAFVSCGDIHCCYLTSCPPLPESLYFRIASATPDAPATGSSGTGGIDREGGGDLHTDGSGIGTTTSCAPRDPPGNNNADACSSSSPQRLLTPTRGRWSRDLEAGVAPAQGSGAIGGVRHAPVTRRSVSLDSEDGWSLAAGLAEGDFPAGIEAFLHPEEEQVRAHRGYLLNSSSGGDTTPFFSCLEVPKREVSVVDVISTVDVFGSSDLGFTYYAHGDFHVVKKCCFEPTYSRVRS